VDEFFHFLLKFFKNKLNFKKKKLKLKIFSLKKFKKKSIAGFFDDELYKITIKKF
jgi:hypothetical protein